MDYLDVGHTVIRRFCTHYRGSTQVGSTKHYLGNSRIYMVKYSLYYHTLPRMFHGKTTLVYHAFTMVCGFEFGKKFEGDTETRTGNPSLGSLTP